MIIKKYIKYYNKFISNHKTYNFKHNNIKSNTTIFMLKFEVNFIHKIF